MPGTVPVTSSAILVIRKPASVFANVAVALVRSSSGALPACARMLDRDIEKHAACAAAISSSGLVLPPDSSVRAAHVTGSGPVAPLLSNVTVPEPPNRSPFHTALPRRSAIDRPPFASVHLPIRYRVRERA